MQMTIFYTLKTEKLHQNLIKMIHAFSKVKGYEIDINSVPFLKTNDRYTKKKVREIAQLTIDLKCISLT